MCVSACVRALVRLSHCGSLPKYLKGREKKHFFAPPGKKRSEDGRASASASRSRVKKSEGNEKKVSSQ